MPARNLILVAVAAATFGLAGCEVDEGPVEDTAESLDEAGDEAADAAKEACEEAAEAAGIEDSDC